MVSDGQRMQPMQPAEFVQQRDITAQYVATQPEEIKKDLALNREMGLASFKSELKMREAANKELLRKKSVEFFERDHKVMLQEKSFNGQQIVGTYVVFGCQLKEVKRYIRDSGEELFQFELQVNDKIQFSQLYEISYLKSCAKLKQTILGMYVNIQAQQVGALAWDWIWQKARQLYEYSKTEYLPDLPGWHNAGGRYSFWDRNRSDRMLQTDAINTYELRYVNCREDDLEGQLTAVDDNVIGKAGVLLTIRLIALLGRICTQEPLASGITLYGDTALAVAKGLLSVSASENNIINLDTDRINEIRSRVKAIREDVIIFVVTNLESKSTQNRIMDVFSWFESGYIEGERVTVPYVFCVKRLSLDFFMENGVFVNADLIAVPRWEHLFDVLQSCWVDTIEKSGSYIVERLVDALKQQAEGGKMVCLSKCIAETTISCIQNRVPKRLQQIFESGIQEIIDQNQTGWYYVESLFHEDVLKAAEKGQILFCDGIGNPFYKEKVIYFDDQYYYFMKDVMELICGAANMSDKALLLLKQQLASQGYSKQYRSTGNHRELQVDISLRDAEGNKRHFPAFAIKRDFWDEMGGVCLYEMGECVNVKFEV